ncbi:MAG: GntR family transcriptional regulator [Pseudomonadota bacterium]
MNTATSRPSTSASGESLAAWLTEILKIRISNGHYKPGEWLREAAFRLEFGLSNGPVREALQNLVAEGALVREARRGVRVVSLTEEEITSLIEVRLGLLELAAELAVHNATADDLRYATDLMSQINDAVAKGEYKDAFPLLGEMIDSVCAMSANDFLVTAWNNFKVPARVYVFASYEATKKPAQVFARWNRLVTAIAERDANAAKTAVRNIYKNTLRELGLKGSSSLFKAPSKSSGV